MNIIVSNGNAMAGQLVFYAGTPKKAGFGQVDGAAQQLNFVWLFKTPEWARGNSECRRLLAYKRVTTLAALVVLGLLLKLL